MAVIASQEKKTEGAISPWSGFQPGLWQKAINVRDFIQQNYKPYDGDGSFLAPATARTRGSGRRSRSCSSRSGKRECSTSPRSRVPSPPTRPATSTVKTKSSSACRPMRRSNARSCRTAASGWSSTRSRPLATNPTHTSWRHSPSIGRPTTTRCSMRIPRMCVAVAARTC